MLSIASIIDPTNGFAYLGITGVDYPPSPVSVVKVDIKPTRTFQRLDAVSLNNDETVIESAVIDPAHGLAYLGVYDLLNTETRKIVKMDVSPSHFARLDALTLEYYHGTGPAVIELAKGYAYFGGATYWRNGVVKVDVNPAHPFAVVGYTFPTDVSGEKNMVSAVIDTTHGIAYFGTETDPGIVIRIKLDSYNLYLPLILKN